MLLDHHQPIFGQGWHQAQHQKHLSQVRVVSQYELRSGRKGCTWSSETFPPISVWKFTLVTDHKSLTMILNPNKALPTLATTQM